MNRRTITGIFVVLVAIAFLTPQASARMSISGTSPVIEVLGVPPALKAAVESELQGVIDGLFDQAITDLNNEEPIFVEDKDKLLKGFATANAYASHSADMIAFADYDFMSIAIGAILSARAPSNLFDLDIEQELKDEGDIEIGASAGATVNVGMKAKFLGDKFLMNAKFGAYEFSGENDTGEGSWSYETQTVGVGVSYQLTEGVGIGVAGWRGITLRSGLIYHKNKAEVEVDPDPEIADIDAFIGAGFGETFTGTVTLDPSVRLGIEMSTYTVPLEVVTGFQGLWIFNLGLGAGIDLSFGQSDLTAEAIGTATADATSATATMTTKTPGELTIAEDTPSGEPHFINFRLTASPGLSLGPVKIEVPATYYPTSGYSIGLTVATLF